MMQFSSDDLIIDIRSGRTDETEEEKNEWKKTSLIDDETRNFESFLRVFSLFWKFRTRRNVSIDCLSGHLILCQLWLKLTFLYSFMKRDLFFSFCPTSLRACELSGSITISFLSNAFMRIVTRTSYTDIHLRNVVVSYMNTHTHTYIDKYFFVL